MNFKRFSIRLILIGFSFFAVGGVAESIRIGRRVSDSKKALGKSVEMEDIKAALSNVQDPSLSIGQILMLVGLILLTIGLLISLARMARVRDQVGEGQKGGGCGGCH